MNLSYNENKIHFLIIFLKKFFQLQKLNMKGDLRYNCGVKVDLCMDKPVLKEKYTIQYMSGKRVEAINRHAFEREQDELVNQLLQRNLQKRV